MPRNDGKPQSIVAQYRDARSEILVGFAHAGVPWALFALLTICGNILRFVISGRIPQVGNWLVLTALLVLLAGSGAAVLDTILRRHRSSKVGRLIGPVTTESGTVMLVTFLLAGYSVPLVLIWTFGGAFACLGWNMWQRHAVHHDLTVGFTTASQRAGLGDARLIPARAPKPLLAGAPADPGPVRVPAPRRSRPARLRGPVEGVVHWPPGEVTPAEAADRAAQLEGAHHWPPGAASLLPNRHDGAASDFVLSDPATLDISAPWPGPSAPGADLSVPFRLAVRQDGRLWQYRVLPMHHMRASGKTGSGKTMGWLFGFQGEAVTRQDYAAWVTDLTKRMQFIGPLSPALHGWAIEPEAALQHYLALQRARNARLDYLYKHGLTEWRPGCGLTFIDDWMEEGATVISTIIKLSKGQAGAQAFTFEDWVEGVRGDRSAGIRHDVSLQFGKDATFPTEARGQFGTLCFGTASRNESRIGLSPEQAENGARPELWGSRHPGMAYPDPGVDNGDDTPVTMPVRLFDWGPDATVAAGYFAEWPAEDRPLDDITAEAMESRPSLPASYGFPVKPAGRSNVIRPAFGRKRVPDRLEAADEAAGVVLAWLRERLAAGTDNGTFTVNDIVKAGVHEKAGRTRPWLYLLLEDWAQTGVTELVADKPKKRWRVTAQAGAAEEM